MLIIREVPIGTLVPYDNNPRHNDEAVEFVANSIKEFGFKVPIVIDRNNVIVTGHTRLKAAKLLGLKKLHIKILKRQCDAALYDESNLKTESETLQELLNTKRNFSIRLYQNKAGFKKRKILARYAGKRSRTIKNAA